MYANFSSELPSDWVSSRSAEINVVDAVPFKADWALKNASELKGNIALISSGGTTFAKKVKRASEAGAVGVIIVNTKDRLFKMRGRYQSSEIPVLGLLEDQAEEFKSWFNFTDTGYKSDIPVLMIKSSDATRLREHGSALIRECAGPPEELSGRYAGFSSALPLDWVSPQAEVDVVKAVPLKADSELENASELKGNIALVSGFDRKFNPLEIGKVTDNVDKVKRVAEAGAVGVIFERNDMTAGMVLGTRNGRDSPDNTAYKSDIPVLMIGRLESLILRDFGTALIQPVGMCGTILGAPVIATPVCGVAAHVGV